MYKFDSRIRYSECDENASLTPEALLNYFQDCSIFQSEDIGFGVEYFKEHHTAWVINFWQIVIEKLPCLGTSVTVGTIPYDIKGFVGHRNFFMDDEDGRHLAKANSFWSYLDMDQMRPVRVPQEMIEAYGVGEKLEMDYCERKIKVKNENRLDSKSQTESTDLVFFRGNPITIRSEHLDTNHHVNNGQYVRMALMQVEEEYVKRSCTNREEMPEIEIKNKEKKDTKEIKEIRAEFRRQALLGDEIYPAMIEENGTQIVYLNDALGAPFAIVQFV